MKATIEFNLPKDDMEYEVATRAKEMFCVLRELDQWLANRKNDTHSEPYRLEKEVVHDEFIEILNSFGITVLITKKTYAG